MPEKYQYEAKISKTTDNKKLATGEKKAYNYGTINLRKPELAKYIGKIAKIEVKIQD
ncbi:MAG: hypothetical protein NTZ73_00300 [Candidatus Diapherotrites archaeon]|nr:hypothetical protein [Candidatus Diapherotrites archaeon]